MSINDESMSIQGDDFHLARIWHDGRWFYCLDQVLEWLTDDPLIWQKLERRLRRQGAEATVDAVVHLEALVSKGVLKDEKWADTETLLRIIQSIPSPKAEPFKQWLARLGVERLEEMENPTLAADRMRRLYRQRGYSDEWIDQRMQGIVVRDELTTEWRERGAEEGREFAILTDILHRGAFDVSTDEHKGIKQLKKRENLRDNMSTLELALTMLSEATSTALHHARDSQGFTPLQHDARDAGEIAGAARQRGSPADRSGDRAASRQRREREYLDCASAAAFSASHR
jgi:DNA-damage-inducible protein D